MNDVGIFSFARTQSQRCPNKMLKDFAGTTLTDIALSKLKELGKNSFFAGYEGKFKSKCLKHGVRFVQRSKKSVTIDGPIMEILSFLKDIDYEYFLIVNPCLPFLKTVTIRSFLDDCLNNSKEPAFSVVRKNNFFMSLKGKPLNFHLSMRTINTKAALPIYEFAHALYFFNKDYFFKHGRYWDWREVRFSELNDKIELFDIDTEDDFKVAEEIYRARQK